MAQLGRTASAVLGLVFAFVAVGGAEAAPPKEARKHQQLVPTGAEDAPAAKARAATAASKSGEALIEHSTRKDTVGLYPEVLSDGSISVFLDDRFHQVSRAVQKDDGTTEVVCGSEQPAPSKKAVTKKGRTKAVKRASAPTSSALEER